MKYDRYAALLAGGALLVSGLALSTGAQAQVTTGNLNVQITITEQCTLGTISDINFGSTGLLAANVDAEGSIQVTCTAGTDYTLALDAGDGNGATGTTRFMTGGGGTIGYELHQNAGRNIPWGTSTDAFSGVGTGSAEVVDVFGRVPPQSTPAAGNYTDTVTVTLAY